MTVKTLTTAALLTVLTAASASAYCSGAKHDVQAMSCAEGSAYDPATNTCKVVTG